MTSLTSLSAGTGPAALVLAGVVLFLAGHTALGVMLFIGGAGLSFFWALRFK